MTLRGQGVPIPFRGMNNQLLDDQSIDGLCDSIVNLKPKGNVERPYWTPFERINNLKNSQGTTFTYTFGINSITDCFFQVRNFIGEYSEDQAGSLKRLLVLCQNSSRKSIDIIEPTTWTVVKTQALPMEGSYSWSCTRLDEITIIALNRDKKPYMIYYLIDDTFIPQGWPEFPLISVDTTTETLDSADVTAGLTKGVMREATDQWFMVTYAFRTFDGSFVRHQAPTLIKVDAGNTNIAVKPVITLEGYSVSENILINQPFWKSLIQGISICATIPRNNEQEALEDGSFFQVGYFPRIDRMPESEWPTATDPNILIVDLKSDAWPTGRKLSIDQLSHHSFAAREVDTYNKRVLLGGRSVNFALPKIKSDTFLGSVPAGVYSDYMDFSSGFATFSSTYFDSSGNPIGSADDPDYSYEINNAEYNSEFTPKTGREFKTVEILNSSPTTGTNNPPGGGSDLPNFIRSATIISGKLVFGMETIETNFGSGGQIQAGQPWMDLKLTIGPIGETADQTLLFRVSPLGNTAPIVSFSGFNLETSNEIASGTIYHKVTIKTDTGTYYRIATALISENKTAVTLPPLIWYPDRRAIRYELFVDNGTDVELALTK